MAHAERAGAEAGDGRPGLNGSARGLGAVEDFEPVADRIGEHDQVLRPGARRRARGCRAATCDAGLFKLRGDGVERGGVRDLPAEEADAFAAVLADDHALLAVVHAEREALARSCPRAACPGTWCRSWSNPRAISHVRRRNRDPECPRAASVFDFAPNMALPAALGNSCEPGIQRRRSAARMGGQRFATPVFFSIIAAQCLSLASGTSGKPP